MLKFNDRDNSFVLFTNETKRAAAAGLTLSTNVRGPNGERVYFTANHSQQPEFNPYAVLEFYNEADDQARKHLNVLHDDYLASWSDASHIHVDAPYDKEYMPYQKAGIAYALERGNCIIGDEPGLGKTIQAIGLANEMRAKKILVICPASIRRNWRREIYEWSTLPRASVQCVEKGSHGIIPHGNFTVISYDLLRNKGIHNALRSMSWDLAVTDEGHYLKSIDAQRTRAVFGGGERGSFFHENGLERNCEVMVSMTGTPLPNRPRECLDGSVKVLTDHGWKSIIDIRIDDLLWDGEEWVKHGGLLYQGCAKTVSVAGILATGTHLFLGKNSWVSADEAAQSTDIVNQLLEKGSANLPWTNLIGVSAVLLNRYGSVAIAEQIRLQQLFSDYGSEGQPGADHVAHWLGPKKQTAGMLLSARTKKQGQGFYPSYQTLNKDVITPKIKLTGPTGVAVFPFTNPGWRTPQVFWNIWCRLKDGTTQLSKWIGLITKEIMSPEISAGQPGNKICQIEDRFLRCNNVSTVLKPVYDIANAGPRQRFTVLSDYGPVISHNCYTLARGLNWESIDYLSQDAFLYRYNPSMQIIRTDPATGEDRHINIEEKGRLAELNARLRCNLMVRRLKKDVLKQLPDKRYEMTYIEPDGAISEILAKEALIEFDPRDLFNPDFTLDGTPISTLRREMGEAMVPRIVDYMRYMLDIVEVPKVILFAHHKSVINALTAALDNYGVAVHRGGMNSTAKDDAKTDFIGGRPRIFLGQLDTMEGIDGLQSICSDVVFAEPAWNPGRNEQCVDRAHRFGQHSNVVAHFLLVEGSFNEKVLNIVLEKAEDIHASLDRRLV